MEYQYGDIATDCASQFAQISPRNCWCDFPRFDYSAPAAQYRSNFYTSSRMLYKKVAHNAPQKSLYERELRHFLSLGHC